MTDINRFIPIKFYLPGWPTDVIGYPEQLDLVGLTGLNIRVAAATRFVASGTLQILANIIFDLPLIPGLSIAALNNGDLTELNFDFDFQGEGFDLSLIGLSAAIRFQTELLKRMESSGDGFIEGPPDPVTGEPQPVEILIEGAELSVNSSGEFTFSFAENAPALTIQPFMIGDTGIVIDVTGLTMILSEEGAGALPASIPADWRGVYLEQAVVYLPEGLNGILPDDIALEDFFIGSGGFCGRVSGEWTVDEDQADLFDEMSGDIFGFKFRTTSIGIEFKQNTLVSGSITGYLQLPFFDEVLQAEVGLTTGGDFTVAVSSGDGLFVLTKENIVSIEVSGLEFVKEADESALKLTGQMTPLIGGLDWPSLGLDGLIIRSDGQVLVEGGWIDIPEQKALDLYGFRMELSQIGFGSQEDDRRWIGFSGGVHLVDGLPAGASVEGLRVIWDPLDPQNIDLTLQGIGIELTIPNVLQLTGDVSLVQEGEEYLFNGNARLDLLPIGVGLDASVKIGHNTDPEYTYIYTFLGIELPIGIPLWATGAALYGISGLYGMNVLPTATNNDWYAWYTATPKFDVTHTGKWGGAEDGRAFGAGMVLGTLFDMGRVVSTKALFALILPGPVILFDGKANVLQTPPGVDEPVSEGVFNMLAVLDSQAGFLQINLDAGWSLSQVIDITASAEAYFDFADPRNWHLYLGQDSPEERRIRAYVVSLFHADAYLMINSQGIATGFGLNWGVDWKFGPVKAILRSWIEAGGGITWQPPQLSGNLGLGGEFEVSVAGFGAGLGVEANLSGKSPTLYWVRGQLILRVKLPAPIKDLEEDILLEWKEDKEPEPEDPFVSIGLEHLKVDETWMLPDYNEERNIEHPLDPDDTRYDPGPIIPLDARPAIAFDRSMKDETTRGEVDLTSVNEYMGGTEIGDYTFDYLLNEIVLEKLSKAGGAGWERVENLYGSWMAIEDGDGEPADRKLQLWAKSPFEFTRRSARAYRDAFLAHHPSWPCGEAPDLDWQCVDWEEEPLDTNHGPVFEHKGLTFILENKATIVPRHVTEYNTQKALNLSNNDTVWILFPEVVRLVNLCLSGEFKWIIAYGNGTELQRIEEPEGEVILDAERIDSILLVRWDNMFLSKICYETQANAEEIQSIVQHITRTITGLTHWASEDEILEPEMWYRLTVKLETVRTHKGQEIRTPYSHYAYFQTAGPPGLILPWTPSDAGASSGASSDGATLDEKPYPEGGQLIDLSPYLRWTIPGNGAVPVYRAYDLGAEFNENYVEQMYGADMVIRILDANGNPLMEEEGIFFLNQWAEAPTAELGETEAPYVTRIKDCLTLPGFSLPADQVFIASSGILLEEDFSGDLDQWTDVNDPGGAPKTHWVVAGGQLTFDGIALPALGALLVAGEDDWTDYAVEVELSNLGDEVGIVFRHNQTDLEFYYRLRLDATGRHLERVSDKEVTVLWTDSVAYVPGDTVRLAIQCHGNRLRGQVDADLLFDLYDTEGILSGKVGIYANSTAAFAHFLVREWPGGVLAPQAMFTAELLGSCVLFQGGLVNGWADANFSWNELVKEKSHIATIGREENWGDYRLEVIVDVTANLGHVGAIVRFSKTANTFTCYRLLINQNEQKFQLAQLDGTYSGNTYDLNDEGRTILWSCSGADCGIDFELDEHDLALTCDGPTLIVELDGQELVSIQDQSPLLSGQAGLYYQGEDIPVFSEFMIRSAPRKSVYHWTFITSRFEGLVEHMDTFTGDLFTEQVSGIDDQQLAAVVIEAFSALDKATQELDSAREKLEEATSEEVGLFRSNTQKAAIDRQQESARHFEALYEVLFDSTYRPLPPVVDISQIVDGERRFAILLETPEPLDWSRINARLSRLNHVTSRFEDIDDQLVLWNDDGSKAFFVRTGGSALLDGEYKLHVDYRLDLGAEVAVLRRSGSTLPEVAALLFSM